MTEILIFLLWFFGAVFFVISLTRCLFFDKSKKTNKTDTQEIEIEIDPGVSINNITISLL